MQTKNSLVSHPLNVTASTIAGRQSDVQYEHSGNKIVIRDQASTLSGKVQS